MAAKLPAPMRALIVDDELPARELLRLLLADRNDVEIVGECKDGRAAVAAVTELRPDLMFLDIRMPGQDGFAVLERLGESAPIVIFVTAYDRYALKAFEYHALDYLLKPIRRERLAQALARVRRELDARPRQRQAKRIRELLEYWHHTPAVEHEPRYLQRVFVKSGRLSLSIETAAIDWIRSDDHFVKISVRGKAHLLFASIGEMEERLDPTRFLRIHRTSIINLSAVREFRLLALGRCQLVLKDGSEHAVSRNRRAVLQERLRPSQQRAPIR